ncbi:hypothetical protein [Rhizobium sp. F40D2]|uniref:hypothetical protein n=1 Tax=Rhizobium sp. F40D2 TaxID=3453141 RepID=UPI003F250881
MSILLVQSHYQDPFTMSPSAFAEATAQGRLIAVREMELTEAHFAAASGLLTTTHLDQVGFLGYAPAVASFLDRGGRWLFSGHMLRPILPELGTYIPLPQPKRADFAQVRKFDHPVFAGIDQRMLETNRGVAGFYGRGHNPMPPGAVAINTLGSAAVPVDWIWARPAGGEILSHAGNEFWGCGDDPEIKEKLARRTVAWLAGELNR